MKKRFNLSIAIITLSFTSFLMPVHAKGPDTFDVDSNEDLNFLIMYVGMLSGKAIACKNTASKYKLEQSMRELLVAHPNLNYSKVSPLMRQINTSAEEELSRLGSLDPNSKSCTNAANSIDNKAASIDRIILSF